METKIQNKITPHGFLEPKIDSTHYLLGSLQELKGLPDIIINQGGQYDAFLPPREVQRRKIEPYNCTNYGTYNALDIYEMMAYGTMIDKAERYGGVVSGTTHQGNDPHTVIEAIRNYGMIPETDLPYDDTIDTWEKYYSPKPMTEKYISIGRDWLNRYELFHEWLWTYASTALKTKQERMMKMLDRSPLGVSVLAWKYRNGYYWKDRGEGDNHWCCCYGYVKGKYWKIFDSYDNTEKKLEWDYDFRFAKRYYLKKKQLNEEKKMLQRIKGTEKVFLILGDKSYWVKNENDFYRLRISQPVQNLEWAAVSEVDKLDYPDEGYILGKEEQVAQVGLLRQIYEALKVMFGRKK